MNAVTTAESVVETHALEGIGWTVLGGVGDQAEIEEMSRV